MGSQKEKKGLLFWIEFISKIVAIPAFIVSLFTFVLHSYEIENLKKLNKLHLEPNLSLMVYGGNNGTNTIQIRNISILPASEIYVKMNVYLCSKDGKKIYSVKSEYPGWHIPELLPTALQTKEITIEEKKQIIFEASLTKNWPEVKDTAEPVIELYVEFHRQSDMKKYSFRKMYFLKDLNLVWFEVGDIKNDSYYSNLFRLVSDYKSSRKLPKIEELGKYKVESK